MSQIVTLASLDAHLTTKFGKIYIFGIQLLQCIFVEIFWALPTLLEKLWPKDVFLPFYESHFY